MIDCAISPTGMSTASLPRSDTCEDVTPHILRHTCTNRLVSELGHLVRRQDWVGHENSQTTMRYAHHLAPGEGSYGAMPLWRNTSKFSVECPCPALG